MLGEKLLAKPGCDCEPEIRTLELLKLRFGDANLHNCEVASPSCCRHSGHDAHPIQKLTQLTVPLCATCSLLASEFQSLPRSLIDCMARL